MDLAALLQEKPGDLLLPHKKTLDGALEGIKNALDPVAPQFSVFDQVHTDGLAADQVFLQAQMVVDGALQGILGRVQSMLPDHQTASSDSEEADSGEDAFQQVEDPSEEENEAESEENDDNELEDLEENPERDDFQESDFVDVSHDSQEDGSDSGDEMEFTADSSAPKSREIEELERDGFNLAEYQQHVLALENADEAGDVIDENIDFNQAQNGSGSDEDIYYEDFFGPSQPSKKIKTAKTASRTPVEPAATSDNDSAGDDEPREAMEAVKRDLFESDEEEELENQTEHLSKFERQQRDLESQIRNLERENIGEKSWGMQGEVRAAQRPQDSLVNAELQFERGAKPVPVVTEDTTHELDDLIRERIRKQQFDDIPRRTLEPERQLGKAELPEVQQTKSQKSLAELYEEDHQRQANPDWVSQQATDEMDSTHRGIIESYNILSRKLDALCSWTYTPRAPQASVEVRADAPAITMEDAQPTTMSTEQTLAPQEIYKPGDEAFTNRSEMATSEKRRKRRQKAKQHAERAESRSKDSKKSSMLGALERSNVTVVDKRGRKRDMRGNKVEDKKPIEAAHIKL